MNKYRPIFLICFTLLTVSAFSQLQTKGNTNEYVIEANKKAKPGSYEILPAKFEEIFTEEAWNNILIQIELKREQDTEVFWQVTPYTRIRIIARNSLTE